MSPAPTTQRTAKQRVLSLLWRGMVLLVVLGALGTARPSHGAPAVSETELKAAFLYNFAKFVTWPATAFPSETAPIQVAVFGDEEFSVRLKELLSDKKAHGRTFEVKRISSPTEAKNFHMVFVTSAENRRAPMLIEVTRKLPILTVGESDQFLEWGGMINFLFEESQLRFEINPEPAEKTKLEISSKLLRLGIKRSPK